MARNNAVSGNVLNLSDVESPEQGARALYEFLIGTVGASESEVVLDLPKSAGKRNGGHESWTVTWEGGPHEWGVGVTLGGNIEREYGGTYEVRGMVSNSAFLAEPYYGFNVQFHET